MKARLAFYKGKGDWTDKAIRLWTKSKYSHVELVVGDYWYSTSPRDMKVRKKKIVPNPDNWDYVDVHIYEENLLEMYNSTRGAKYDWLGILLSQFIPLSIHNRDRWFCSEWCAEILYLDYSNEYSPQDLYAEVTNG